MNYIYQSYYKATDYELNEELLKEQKETISTITKSLEKSREKNSELDKFKDEIQKKSDINWNDTKKLEQYIKRQQQYENLFEKQTDELSIKIKDLDSEVVELNKTITDKDSKIEKLNADIAKLNDDIKKEEIENFINGLIKDYKLEPAKKDEAIECLSIKGLDEKSLDLLKKQYTDRSKIVELEDIKHDDDKIENNTSKSVADMNGGTK